MTHDDIASLEEHLRQAMLSDDVARLDELLDDDLVFVMADGAIINKETDLAAHASGQIRLTALDPCDQHIVIRGGAAVVSVLMGASGVYAGHVFEASYRYLRFWSETPAGWRVVGGSMAVCS